MWELFDNVVRPGDAVQKKLGIVMEFEKVISDRHNLSQLQLLTYFTLVTPRCLSY